MHPPSKTQRLLPGVPAIESPLFNLADMGLCDEDARVAHDLNAHGFAVLNFPDLDIHVRADRIREELSREFDLPAWRQRGWSDNIGLRVHDAWASDPDVKAIACNEAVLGLLSRLYGRRAFPFQTLNFPVGTQQPVHSDAVHFSSAPERFMCGVWLALEDIESDAGPLVVYPGSHKWRILYNDMIEVGRWTGQPNAQAAYEEIWTALIAAESIKPERLVLKKGQAVIWAANLLHGGSKQTNPAATRWSQVTHYLFDNCIYYRPAYSDPLAGTRDVRGAFDISLGTMAPDYSLALAFGAGAEAALT